MCPQPRPHWPGTLLLALVGPLLFVAFLQLVITGADHLENISMLSGDDAQRAANAGPLAREQAALRLGELATLVHVILGVALIPLGVGLRRRRAWARSVGLVAAGLALLASGVLSVLLQRAGEEGTAWLSQFAPAMLVGFTLLGSCLSPWRST
jgi:hypothetical protein